LASVVIGILVTAFLQSSGTTTAIIVSLVSGGLDVDQAIYMVFVRYRATNQFHFCVRMCACLTPFFLFNVSFSPYRATGSQYRYYHYVPARLTGPRE
jgi:hypothetical protein